MPPLEAPLRVFRDAAATDPDLAAASAEYERGRYDDDLVVVGSCAHLLRDGLTVERATDIFWSALSLDTAHNLRQERGWSVEDYADWLVDAVDRLLLRVGAPRGRAGEDQPG